MIEIMNDFHVDKIHSMRVSSCKGKLVIIVNEIMDKKIKYSPQMYKTLLKRAKNVTTCQDLR